MSQSKHNRRDNVDDSDGIEALLRQRRISSAERTKERRLERALKTHNVDELIEDEDDMEIAESFLDSNEDDWLEYQQQKKA